MSAPLSRLGKLGVVMVPEGGQYIPVGENPFRRCLAPGPAIRRG
ncbi:MAG: hypothetical protein AB1816_01510 [Bacillota bacterium]